MAVTLNIVNIVDMKDAINSIHDKPYHFNSNTSTTVICKINETIWYLIYPRLSVAIMNVL